MNNAFMSNPAVPPSPPVVIRSSGHQSAVKIILTIVAAMIAALLGLIVLIILGVNTGPAGLLIGLICAMLPVPLYLVLILWIDRYEAEPLWMLATAFLWGALVAGLVAYVINTSVEHWGEAATQSKRIAENLGAVISAPIVEESAKASILVIFFFWKKDEFDGILDGIVYAGMVGLGFAMTENVLYYGHYYNEMLQTGKGDLRVILVLRGVMSPFSHPLFTAMTGIGLGWARQSDNGFVKVTMPVLGFMLAVALHGTWNGALTYGGLGWFLVAYILIMVPALVITMIIIFFAWRREGRIVRQFLYPDYQKGLFGPQEYLNLCTIRGRMFMSWTALTKRGFATWRVRMRCNQIASELAFHRSRVVRGLAHNPQSAQERESAYLRMLQDLYQQLASGQRRAG